MRTRQIISGVTAVTLALAGVLVGSGMASAEDLAPPPTDPIVEVVEETSPPAPETAPPPPAPVSEALVAPQTAPEVTPHTDNGNSEKCEEPGYEAKQDTTGDPATVEYTAPDGFLVDAYCVKASTTKVIVPITPPQKTVIIDHPDVPSVSHYQVRLVADEEPEVPIKPEPVVYYGEWGVGEVDCETRTVTEGRYVWTHDWTYDEATNSWIENVTGTETVETREVPATEEQCPLPPAPIACVGVGDWYTEHDDLPPVQVEEGLLFEGGSGQAVGIRVPVTGNLQGWESLTFSATGGTEQFFFRIVIDASTDGGKAYQSLSFPGHTTINQDSVSYQFGESIAATAERFPNAVITSVGFQTNSGAPEGFEAVLHSVTSPCVTVDFSYDPPTPVIPVQPTAEAGVEECVDGESVDANGSITLPEVEGMHWEGDGGVEYSGTLTDVAPGEYMFLAIAEEGYVIEGDAEVFVTVPASVDVECPIEPTPTPTPTTPAPAGTTPPTTSGGLAVTGGEMNPIVPIGAGIAVFLGGIALMLTQMVRARRNH